MKHRRARWMVAIGLLLITAAMILHHEGPAALRNDGLFGFLIGVGMALELLGVVQLEKARRAD